MKTLVTTLVLLFVASICRADTPSLIRNAAPAVFRADPKSGHAPVIESAVLTGEATAPAEPLALWYRAPATDWEGHALPIGNGFLGVMIFGGVASEHIQFNEHSLWTGSDVDEDTGAYQPFGDLYIDLGHTAASDYRRELDLHQAIARVTYTANGIHYIREYFASYPDHVVVVRLTADKPAACTATLRLTDAHHGIFGTFETSFTIGGFKTSVHAATISGVLSNHLQYYAMAQIINDGGAVSIDDTSIHVSGADSITAFLDAGTNYLSDSTKGWLGAAPGDRVAKNLSAVAAKSYDQLKAAHIADYQSLFNRVSLNLGKSPDDVTKRPTDARLAAYKKSDAPNDPELEALLFNYGRYLLISSSRADTLPANLQGIWNMYPNPPWRSDYHSDVNLQMNYWPAETTALPECHQSMLNYIQSMIPARRENSAAKLHTSRGWAVRGENNIFGAGSWNWCYTANAWYAQHFWEHYAFTQDKEYLRTQGYPVIKEVVQFWEDRLIARSDGKLVVPQGFSPEHGPTEDGVTFDQELIYDLFTNYIEAAIILNVDADYRGKISTMRSKLLAPQIGKWGQLQEWAEDMDDPNDTHRHVSHMFALHPGREISPLTTPDLAAAAKISLNARGDASTGWSTAWKIPPSDTAPSVSP